MEYRILGKTGVKVSEFCLGTMTFGDQADEAASLKMTATALDAGVNFIDTANIYTGGKSEIYVGKALKGIRDNVVLASKTGGGMSRTPNASGLSRKNIVKSVEDSLKRLDTDYLDILYAHFPDRSVDSVELLMTMNDLIRSGKIRYWAISNFSAWQSCELQLLAEKYSLIAPCATESVYNAITRGIEDELIPLINKYNFGLCVFNPLAGGMLTGKHSRERFAENSRLSLEKGYAARYGSDRNFDAVEVLKKVAEEEGMSMVELSYRWLLSEKALTSVIVGASKLEQLTENLSYFDGKPLSAEAKAKCEEAWALVKGSYFNYHR